MAAIDISGVKYTEVEFWGQSNISQNLKQFDSTGRGQLLLVKVEVTTPGH